MAEDVQPRRGMYGGRHGARVQRVADAECGLEDAVRDAGFGFFGHEVEDGCARRLRARARSGGHGDERLKRFDDGHPLAERRVDEVEEIRVREAGVEVHQLGGVDDGPAADGEECVWRVGLREVDGGADAVVFRLDADLVVDCE